MLHSFEEEAERNLGRALIKAFADKGVILTDGIGGPEIAGKPVDLSELVPDAERIVWFVFDEPEARGAVGVRRDNWGLGIYLRPSDIGHAVEIDPADGSTITPRVASVDLFHRSAEAEATSDAFVQLVIDDTASDDVVAVARFLPTGTEIMGTP